MKLKIFFVLSLLMVATSCKKEELLDRDRSVVSLEEAHPSELDSWIEEALTKPYNIAVSYKNDVLNSAAPADAIPAREEQVQPLLEFIRKMLIEPLVVLKGDAFVKTHLPHQINLYGDAYKNEYGAELLYDKGVGEILSIYRVNEFDPSNLKSVERTAQMVMHGYIRYLLDRYPADLEVFALVNFRGYSRWDLSGRELGQYDAKLDYLLEEGFFSKMAELGQYDDFVETLSMTLITPTAVMSRAIKAATTVPEGTSKKDLVKVSARVAAAKATIEGKESLVEAYLQEHLGLSLHRWTSLTAGAISKYKEQHARAND